MYDAGKLFAYQNTPYLLYKMDGTWRNNTIVFLLYFVVEWEQMM